MIKVVCHVLMEHGRQAELKQFARLAPAQQ
jgi:hypothetical protein